MFEVKGLHIQLTRGDTGDLEIQLEGDIPSQAAGDKLIMTLKKTPESLRPVWEKEAIWEDGSTAIFRIRPEDTAGLPFGCYWWDIRAFYHDGGDVETPMHPAEFYVLRVVGNDRGT